MQENGRRLPSHLPTGPSVAAARAPPRPPSALPAGDEEPRGARRGGGKRDFRPEPSSLTCLRQGRRRPSSRPERGQPGLSGLGWKMSLFWSPEPRALRTLSLFPGNVRRMVNARFFLKPRGPSGEQTEATLPGTVCALERSDSGGRGTESPVDGGGGHSEGLRVAAVVGGRPRGSVRILWGCFGSVASSAGPVEQL